MQRRLIPGGWYVDARVGGEFACVLYGEAGVVTHAGRVPVLPPRDAVTYPLGGRPLYVRLPDDGPFRFAGINQETDEAIEWRDGSWRSHGPACGASGVIYAADGTVARSDCRAAIGSHGWRYLADDGRLITGQETYSPADDIDLFEWTDVAGRRFGQGPDDGAFMFHAGRYHVLEPAGVPVRNLRVRRRGDDVAIAYVVASKPSMVIWATLDELAALPSVDTPRRLDISGPVWYGAYTFDNPSPNLPQNCTLRVALGQTRAPIHALDGREVAYYVAGHPGDGNIADIERAIREERQAGHARIVAYLPKSLLDAGVWSTADVQGVEMYLRKAEDPKAFVARLRRSLAACRVDGRAVAAIPQIHTSNPGLSTDVRLVLRLVVPLIREYADVVRFVLLFSAGDGRSGGWNDNPGYHDAWRAVFATTETPVVLAPLPGAPDGEHNAGTDTPPPPVVAPPSDLLLPGESLVPERAGATPSTYSRVSKGGRYRLIVLGDGHFVLQDLHDGGKTIWDFGWWADRVTNQGGVGNLVPEGLRTPVADGRPPHSGLTQFGDLAYLVTQDARVAAIGIVGGVIAYADTNWRLEP